MPGFGRNIHRAFVGADRIRPQPDEAERLGEWYNVGCCPVQPGTIEKPGFRAAISRPYKAYAFIRVLAEIRGCGRLRASPTRRMRSSGCFLKSGVTGGKKFAPGQVHPGAININNRTGTAPVRRSTAAVPDSTGTGCRRASRRTGSRRSCPPDGDRPCRRFPCG